MVRGTCKCSMMFKITLAINFTNVQGHIMASGNVKGVTFFHLPTGVSTTTTIACIYFSSLLYLGI